MNKARHDSAEPEYLEGDSGWGFWQEGWVDKDGFVAATREVGFREMGLSGNDWSEATDPPVHGYARHSTAGDEHNVRLSETANGGRRTTYVWYAL